MSDRRGVTRRTFCRQAVVAPAALSLAGCGIGSPTGDGLWPAQVVSTPAFSAPRLTTSLEQLRQGFEDRGRAVSAHLHPGLDESEVRRRCSWFPAPLPAEVVALYGWHDGQTPDAERTADAFLFRDCAFISLDRARDAYRTMTGAYGAAAAIIGAGLTTCFPIAEFEGAALVVPCEAPPAGDTQLRPVVSVFEGIEVFFYSVERMVETCLDWVRHPDFDPRAGLPRPAELEIWRQHNPGIFPGAR